MTAIIMLFLDRYAFFEFTKTTARNTMTPITLIFNILTSVILLISVIATVFSGYDYLKGGKDILKDM